MRLDIVGLPATGKSTLAEAVAKKLSIPHIHLDRFWFESGGDVSKNIEEVRKQVRAKVIEVLTSESWVSDGTYLHVQDLIAARADRIIFLDIPLWRRLLNHALRLLHPEQRHKETSFWKDFAFFWEIVRRTYTSKPKLLRFINEHAGKVTTLRSHSEIAAYLKSL